MMLLKSKVFHLEFWEILLVGTKILNYQLTFVSISKIAQCFLVSRMSTEISTIDHPFSFFLLLLPLSPFSFSFFFLLLLLLPPLPPPPPLLMLSFTFQSWLNLNLLCGPGWPCELKLAIILPLVPKFCSYRHAISCPDSAHLFICQSPIKCPSRSSFPPVLVPHCFLAV